MHLTHIDQYTRYLDLLRFDGDGTPGRAPVRIASDPAGARGYSLTRWGDDVVASWIGGGCPGAILMARVVPWQRSAVQLQL
jgi:hypothetical protein